jgi:outer membrane autotransporter protein
VSALRLALLSAVAVPSSAYAQAVWTNPGSGDWQVGANWSTGTAPSGFDSPIINNGGTALISGTAASAAAVSVAAAPSSNGSLSILNGGTLTFSLPFSTSVIGYGAGSVGALTVDGVGSSLNASSGTLFVGTSGQGTMTVSNGGSIQVQFLDLAGGNTGQGTVNVTSNGSLIVDGATLGRGSGVATLNIAGGGTATFTSQLALGYDLGSAATANVTGPGSTLSVGSFFRVGGGVNSTGTLNLSNGGTAVAGGGSGTILLGAGAGASGFLNIGAAPGNPAAAAGVVSAAAVSLSPTSAINFNHTDAGYVFAPQIIGSGSIHVYSGTTILMGANTYTGGTTITGGVLSVSADANLGDAAGALNFDGGTLENTAAFTSARNVVLGDNGGTFKTDASLALTGTIIGNGFLDKGGTGTLTLTGVNSYTGGTLVAAGTLALAGPGQLDPGGSVSMAAGATFDIAAASGDRTIGDLNGADGSAINLGANRLFVGTSNDTVFGGTIQGSGGLTKQGSGELTLTGANTYTGDTAVTGGTSLAPSVLAVSGAAASLGSPGSVIEVGPAANDVAELQVSAGAQVRSFSGYVGVGAGSSGAVTVSGSGSQWTNTDDIFVGYLGTGSLTIEDGGTVSAANNAYFGSTPGGSGTATVSGAGSQLNTTNDIVVGFAGTGALTIESGGTASDRTGYIGYWAGTTGTAVVSGAGSQWTNREGLHIGYLGTGSLTIENGGAVTAPTTYLGTDTSGQGTLSLTGSAGARGLLTTGQVVKGAGSATLTLDGGMLQATADQPDFLSNFAPGDVVVNAGGALIDSNGHSIGLAAALSGSGGLIKTGAGLLTLTGTSLLSGPSSVLAGQLAVNGSIANSAVTVGPGATLSGTGTIGGLSALSGATIAPGPSIGTLNVGGNVAFAAGSTYAVETNAAGQLDRIAATGTATLSGGSVQVLPDQGIGYVADVPFTILTANGGVTGAFSGTSGGEFAFVTPTLRYGHDTVTLTLVRKTEPPTPPNPPEPPQPPTLPEPPVPPQPVAFHSVAVTKNQYSTADGVEALGEGNHLYDILLGASVPGARQAFDALSGEAHASAVTVAYEDGRLVREAILTRLRQPMGTPLPAFAQGSYGAAYAAALPGSAAQPVAVVPSFDPRRFALWGEGFGSWGRVGSNGNAAGLETSTGGFIIGADAQLDPAFRLGVAGGFTRTSFDIDGRLSSGTNESVFGALYGSATWGRFNLQLGASYAAHDLDVSRRVLFPGFGDAANASYDGSTLQAFGEIGYGLTLGLASLEPFVGASVLRLHTDAFQEDGGVAALTGFGRTYELGTTMLGLRAAAQISSEVPLTLRAMLGWRRAYGDVEPAALLAFAGGASAFTVSGIPVDRNALAVEAGLDWQATQDISLGVAYSGQIGSHAQDHALKGNFTWRFDTR